EEGAGIVDVLIGHLLASHLHVAAEEDQRKSVVRLSAANPEEARAESKTEGFDSYVEESGRPEMTQLVDHDHYADQDQQPQYVFSKLHISSNRRGARRASCRQLPGESTRLPVHFQN